MHDRVEDARLGPQVYNCCVNICCSRRDRFFGFFLFFFFFFLVVIRRLRIRSLEYTSTYTYTYASARLHHVFICGYIIEFKSLALQGCMQARVYSRSAKGCYLPQPQAQVKQLIIAVSITLEFSPKSRVSTLSIITLPLLCAHPQSIVARHRTVCTQVSRRHFMFYCLATRICSTCAGRARNLFTLSHWFPIILLPHITAVLTRSQEQQQLRRA